MRLFIMDIYKKFKNSEKSFDEIEEILDHNQVFHPTYRNEKKTLNPETLFGSRNSL